MSCSYTHVLHSLNKINYTNHSVVHVDTCKVAIEPCSDHSHHRPPCVSECLGTHKCTLHVESLFFSNVKVLWVPSILDCDDFFFYFFHSNKIFIVNFAVRLFIDSRVSSSGGSSPPPPPPPPKGREKEEKKGKDRERERER